MNCLWWIVIALVAVVLVFVALPMFLLLTAMWALILMFVLIG